MKNLENKILGKEMSLYELSEILINEHGDKFDDIFNYSVEGDILDLESKDGSFSDREGENIIYFDIVKIDENSHLNTIIRVKKCEFYEEGGDTIISVLRATATFEKVAGTDTWFYCKDGRSFAIDNDNVIGILESYAVLTMSNEFFAIDLTQKTKDMKILMDFLNEN